MVSVRSKVVRPAIRLVTLPDAEVDPELEDDVFFRILCGAESDEVFDDEVAVR